MVFDVMPLQTTWMFQAMSYGQTKVQQNGQVANVIEIGRLAGLDRRWYGGHTRKNSRCSTESRPSAT
jgi:hypothetical protein